MHLKHSALMLTIGLALVACSGGNEASKSTQQSANSSSTATPAATDKLQTKFVTIATGGASGPYNIIGTALTEVYSKTYGVNSKPQTTGASVENINLMNQNKAEMAFVMSDTLSDAIKGTNGFTQPITSVSQIATLYPN